MEMPWSTSFYGGRFDGESGVVNFDGEPPKEVRLFADKNDDPHILVTEADWRQYDLKYPDGPPLARYLRDEMNRAEFTVTYRDRNLGLLKQQGLDVSERTPIHA